LGYGFSWYLRGPYSSTLAKDYYNMPRVDFDAPEAPALKPEVAQRLAQVRAIIEDENRPANLDVADWLEIVASVHYLERVSRLSAEDARTKLSREKPRLVEYLDVARTALEGRYPRPQAH